MSLQNIMLRLTDPTKYEYLFNCMLKYNINNQQTTSDEYYEILMAFYFNERYFRNHYGELVKYLIAPSEILMTAFMFNYLIHPESLDAYLSL